MPKDGLDAVIAGHVCIDITPAFGGVSGTTIAEILRPGQLVRMEGVQINPGGAVGNTGPALHRLGLRVALMGKCGADPFGQILLERLRELAPGAEASMHVVESENTSYTIVIAPPGIDRMFLHCPDANDTFGPEDVDLSVVGRSRLFHFGYPPLMRRMYADGGAEAGQILKSVRDAGVATCLDLSFPDPGSDAGRADWRALLARTLPYVDLFLPSLDELLFMLDRGRFDELAGKGGSIADTTTADDLRRLAGRCLEMGASVVGVKCGHAGAYLKTADPGPVLRRLLPSPELWRAQEIFEPSCKVGQIASTTGAGDAAIAGFLAGVLRGEDPQKCMALMTAVGAQNLTAVDTVSGLKSWEETVADLEAGPAKNPVPPALRELTA